MAPQTVGAAITDVLSHNGALPLAELAEQIRAAGREVSGGTLSNTLQTMKKRGAVTSGDGKWMLPKTRTARARA
jgi:Fe2+ or Zn2+ uptake regulation protein